MGFGFDVGMGIGWWLGKGVFVVLLDEESWDDDGWLEASCVTNGWLRAGGMSNGRESDVWLDDGCDVDESWEEDGCEMDSYL